MIRAPQELDRETIRIWRKEGGQSKKLGDYLNAHHESVHSGQIMCYLKTMGIEQPQIWD